MAITVSSFDLPQAVGVTVVSSDNRERVDYLLGIAQKEENGPYTVEVMKVGWVKGERDEGEILLSVPVGVQ